MIIEPFDPIFMGIPAGEMGIYKPGSEGFSLYNELREISKQHRIAVTLEARRGSKSVLNEKIWLCLEHSQESVERALNLTFLKSREGPPLKINLDCPLCLKEEKGELSLKRSQVCMAVLEQFK